MHNMYLGNIFCSLYMFFLCRLTDVKFLFLLRSVLFFFYCWFLPCVILGKKTVEKFENTEKKKTKAKRRVVKKALANGRGYKYLVGEDIPGNEEDNVWEPEVAKEGEQEGLPEKENEPSVAANPEQEEEEVAVGRLIDTGEGPVGTTSDPEFTQQVNDGEPAGRVHGTRGRDHAEDTKLVTVVHQERHEERRKEARRKAKVKTRPRKAHSKKHHKVERSS